MTNRAKDLLKQLRAECAANSLQLFAVLGVENTDGSADAQLAIVGDDTTIAGLVAMTCSQTERATRLLGIASVTAFNVKP